MRPWVLRALVMTAVYGVGQAAFVALRGAAPELSTLWTLIFLGVLLAVGVVWAGTEVILGRTPEEWSWFRAALAAAPSAGVLTWLLLIIFVDGSGVSDLGAALVGRASFTALLIMGSTFVGTRLGWLSLTRRGEGDGDPMLDRDETDPDEIAAMSASGSRGAGGALPAATVERVARRRRGRIGTGGPDASPEQAPTERIGDVSPEDDEVYRGGRESVGSAPTATATGRGAGAGDAGADGPTAVDAGTVTRGTRPRNPSAAVVSPPDSPPDSPSDSFASRDPAAGARTDLTDDAGSETVRPDTAHPDSARPGASGDEWEPAAEPPGDRTARFAPPVVAVLPESDPRFAPAPDPAHGSGRSDGRSVSGDDEGSDGRDDPAGARGPRRSVAEAARAARIARAQTQQDEKRGGDDKRRRGPRRRPAR